jgi:hypothetical protein
MTTAAEAQMRESQPKRVEIPLPPPRPNNLAGPEAAGRPQTATTAVPPEEATACIARLNAIGVTAEPATSPESSDAQCRVNDPVRLTGMRPGPSSASITFRDKPLLDCRAAELLALWIRDVAAGIVQTKLGAPIATLHTGPGFECRRRNRAPSGKLSAHAAGLAVDIARIDLADGTALSVAAPDARQKPALDALRRSACGWFSTVLGPGSDAAHADHLHFDIEDRGTRGGGKFCQ